jgi:hypothetical protein
MAQALKTCLFWFSKNPPRYIFSCRILILSKKGLCCIFRVQNLLLKITTIGQLQHSEDLIKYSFICILAMQDGYIFNMKKTRPLDVLYERGDGTF